MSIKDTLDSIADAIREQTGKTELMTMAQMPNEIRSIGDKIYPVGSIYMSVNSTNPQTLFGGTWEQIKDKFLLSAGDSYSAGATGGEATHVLTTYEMPRHTHDQYNWLFNGATATGTHYGFGWQENTGTMINMNSNWAYNGLTGDGAAHNNMPPYLAVYVWKRTA